jgi:epoxyqueuosine reductase QueG
VYSLNGLREIVEGKARELGCSALGVADLTGMAAENGRLFENVEGEYARAVVMGVRLQDAVVEEIIDHPTILYFHNYRQANYQLDRLGWTIADLLQNKGHRAMAIPASQIVKRDPMRGHVSHRRLGELAGIGFRGRNNLLVHPEHGARMRYVTVLTDAPLEPDAPYSGEGCGGCRACIAVCPAGAIGETSKDYKLDACYAKLTEFTRLPFIGQHICGVCVKACPSKLAERSRAAQEEARKNHG